MSFSLVFLGADGSRRCNCCNCCDVLGNGVSIVLSGGPSAECVHEVGSYDIKHTATGGSANVTFGGSGDAIGNMQWYAYSTNDGSCGGAGARSEGNPTMTASAVCDRNAGTITVTITSIYINRNGYFVFNCETLAFISATMDFSPYGVGPSAYTVTISEAP